MMTQLRKLHLQHLAWIHAKLSLAFVGYLYFFVTPSAHLQELGYTLTYTIGAFICIGSLVSIVGLLISLMGAYRFQEKGLLVEFFGLIIAVTGVVTFTVTQVTTLVRDPNEGTLLRTAFVYAMAAFLLARLASMSRYLKVRF
jgi:hypothetical protein